MSAVAEFAPSVTPPSAARTIRIGILGLGQVGQAVARLSVGNSRLIQAGLRFRVTGALVRDTARQRHCPAPPRLTADPTAFLRGQYDVVIEALGAIEPARTIVTRLLSRGIPVVTANKALVAAHGGELCALAAHHATTLRYEASALAGVPFLGALAARPLVSDVRQFAAVVNGTSNFILSKLDEEKTTFAGALAQAQALGLTEPDPSRDLDGLDAADKLSLLASVFGWGDVAPHSVDVQGIADVTPQCLAAARVLGATIKPVVWASQSPAGISAFIGPTLVPARHPLAALSGTLCGIQLSGRYVSELFFSGPGAGPEVTAATVLDDVVEAVSAVPNAAASRFARAVPPRISAPDTEWLVAARFPGVLPDRSAATQMFRAQNLDVADVIVTGADALWVRVQTASRRRLNDAMIALSRTHRVQCHAMRSLML